MGTNDIVYRLRKRAEIRRQISTRKSVQEGRPDKLSDLLEEAAKYIETLENINKPNKPEDPNKCDHKNYSEYTWEWDNGYGQQEWLIGHRCKKCGKRNSFPSISGTWYDPKDIGD